MPRVIGYKFLSFSPPPRSGHGRVRTPLSFLNLSLAPSALSRSRKAEKGARRAAVAAAGNEMQIARGHFTPRAGGSEFLITPALSFSTCPRVACRDIHPPLSSPSERASARRNAKRSQRTASASRPIIITGK